MTTPPRPYQSRVLSGLCHWVRLKPEPDAALTELAVTDPYTWGKLDGLMREASLPGGLPAAGRKSGADYRTPLKFAPSDITDPPWIGELKVVGKRRKRLAPLDWRLYFGEPLERQDMVIAAGLGHKAPEDPKGVDKQIQQVRKAMRAVKHHCKSENCTYAPFD